MEAKVGGVEGWQDLLSYTGFHFIGAMKDVPATIVFPEHDDSGLQRKAMRHLEALLGLPQPCLLALASLSKRPDVATPLLTAVSSPCSHVLHMVSCELFAASKCQGVP